MQMTKYTVRFITPAFLGDAEQKGAWRAPPFKALIRQWWRVLAAKEHGYDHTKLREAEGRLFGHAWLEGDKGKSWSMKSQILIRLNPWKRGTLERWPTKEPPVAHPEVEIARKGIGAHLYLGYGPLNFDRTTKGSRLVVGSALDLEEQAELTLCYPDSYLVTFRKIMQLMQWLGTAGGRSRNGWGSFVLEGEGVEGFDTLKSSAPLIEELSRPIDECLKRDWPHAIGRDQKSVLIWKSKKSLGTWSEAVKELAELKIRFRTALPFNGPKGKLENRHILAYPVTNHTVNGWQKGRLANQIRFKIARQSDKYFGIVYHLPCRLPDNLIKDFKGSQSDLEKVRANELKIWQRVHKSLDENNSFERI
jgi:CRISPR-associated protein Cmr1